MHVEYHVVYARVSRSFQVQYRPGFHHVVGTVEPTMVIGWMRHILLGIPGFLYGVINGEPFVCGCQVERTRMRVMIARMRLRFTRMTPTKATCSKEVMVVCWQNGPIVRITYANIIWL
jgi:hypothetical protein